MNAEKFDMAVIIPANNEEEYIGSCLGALLAQDKEAGRLQIIVAANACTDRTEEIVNSHVPEAQALGWELICQSSPVPGKLDALNRADKLVRAPSRTYIDADVTCDSGLFGQLRDALDRPEPTYATGTINVAPAKTWTTRHYADVWVRLPFVQGGAVGAGLFAVNRAGRARWRDFPSIIADDTYARLHFSPDERTEVPAGYRWPMVEGLRNLIRVRRRQDAGVLEVYQKYPELRKNEGKAILKLSDVLKLAAQNPVGFSIYMIVHLAVRIRSKEKEWSRGR